MKRCSKKEALPFVLLGIAGGFALALACDSSNGSAADPTVESRLSALERDVAALKLRKVTMDVQDVTKPFTAATQNDQAKCPTDTVLLSGSCGCSGSDKLAQIDINAASSSNGGGVTCICGEDFGSGSTSPTAGSSSVRCAKIAWQ